ncbi:hypothetical protein HZS55_15765 [Halosimplex rubrum]|uniref:Uncharacterized protein n=1 Tax=Halosimplex rubrum TaxID=869889 RepID=A0A7D5T7Y4_9EURY|nr:hypothetical protein [Halosimplex rubrum]QLH78655.1 hypothetical protein HZS55_15765 [Halosimplex rubrum]
MDDAEKWREVGRKAVGMELEDARYDVESALYAITVDTMFRGGDPTADQVKEARMALNLAHRILEEYVAPAAGCEPWGDPVPDMPYGRAKEVYHLE